MTGRPRSSFRIYLDNGIRLGPGKIALLERIAAEGSIRSAGAAMGMSYRRAWLLGDEINRMFLEPAFVTRHGGKSGGGAELTAFGRELLARYRNMEAAAIAAMGADLDWLGAHAAPEAAVGSGALDED